jgi:ribose 5-phosphate isomerase B
MFFKERRKGMKIALACDHGGYELKEGIKDSLSQRGIDHEDFGCGPEDQVDYVDYAEKAVNKLLDGDCDRAILFCGTGLGMAMVANKHRTVRATCCWDEYSAEMSRKHNDSNCLTLGGRVIPLDEAMSIVKIWLSTEFEGGRHQRRIDKIIDIEKRYFKIKRRGVKYAFI